MINYVAVVLSLAWYGNGIGLRVYGKTCISKRNVRMNIYRQLFLTLHMYCWRGCLLAEKAWTSNGHRRSGVPGCCLGTGVYVRKESGDLQEEAVLIVLTGGEVFHIDAIRQGGARRQRTCPISNATGATATSLVIAPNPSPTRVTPAAF